MVTCTAIAFAILQHPSQRHAGERSAQAQQVVAEDVGQQQGPLPLLEERHAFERVAGESRERSAEADHHKQPPARVEQHALTGPDYEEAHDEAAYDVDGKSPVGEDRPEFSGRETADDIPQVGADYCGQGYSEEVFHCSSPTKSLHFCRSYQPALGKCGRLWRTPSP